MTSKKGHIDTTTIKFECRPTARKLYRRPKKFTVHFGENDGYWKISLITMIANYIHCNYPIINYKQNNHMVMNHIFIRTFFFSEVYL